MLVLKKEFIPKWQTFFQKWKKKKEFPEEIKEDLKPRIKAAIQIMFVIAFPLIVCKIAQRKKHKR
jgi:hypothetical protein